MWRNPYCCLKCLQRIKQSCCASQYKDSVSTIATYTINTYRQPARLFITGGSELKSPKGRTNGDPLAMAIYAISLQPLITRLGISGAVKQCWYADDASGSGSLEAIKQWWDEMTEVGLIWDITQTLRNVGLLPNLRTCSVLE